MAAAPLTEREQKVYLAKLCEQAERYDEMGNYMREVGEMEEELNAEERNLLSVAYKNAVGYRRAAWRVVNSLEQKERSRGNFDNAAAAEGYKKKIEGELAKICDEILKLIRMSLLAKASTGEDKVFYLKMKGDYYRYKAEFEPNEQNLKNQAQGAYYFLTFLLISYLPALTQCIYLGRRCGSTSSSNELPICTLSLHGSVHAGIR